MRSRLVLLLLIPLLLTISAGGAAEAAPPDPVLALDDSSGVTLDAVPMLDVAQLEPHTLTLEPAVALGAIDLTASVAVHSERRGAARSHATRTPVPVMLRILPNAARPPSPPTRVHYRRLAS